MANDLRKRGWTFCRTDFVGPTTAYAFMQATGMVNDHVEECCWPPKIETARQAFRPFPALFAVTCGLNNQEKRLKYPTTPQ